MARQQAAGLMLVLAASGCSPEDAARSRALIQQARGHAERGINQAERGLNQAERGLNQAERELGRAREHYQIDAKVEEARRQLGQGLDDAADAFSSLAEQGLERGAEVSEQLAYQPIAGAAAAIHCQGSRCTMAADFIDRLARDPRQLTREAMLVPGRSPAGSAGLRLSAVQPGSVPALLGLRDGDLLLALNGATLDSLEAIRAVDEALAGRDVARLQYERDGVAATLEIVRDPPGSGSGSGR